MHSRLSKYGWSLLAHPVALITGLLLLAVSSNVFAQQRVIVNPTFVKRFDRNGNAMANYDASVPNSFCSQPGSCLRYLGDARCLPPANTPVDTQGCMAGWITTDPYDGNTLFPFVQDGHIKAPTQVGIGPNLEGLSVPNGSAELNAENPGRIYQIVCLAGGESIPFSYSLGDPSSTVSSDSQARFGIFQNNANYPGDAVSVVDSEAVSTPMGMVHQEGTVTAPANGGLYQIGFEAILPDSGNQGNYIADVSITLKPLVDFATPAVPIPEGQSDFLLVRVNGAVPAGGISVSLQPGASTASPSDFTLGTPVAFGSSVVGSASLSSNGAGGYLLFIPEGAYDGNALSNSRNETDTNPSGSVRIPISTTPDAIIEDDETYSLTVESPGSNGSSPIAQWDLATAASCSPSPSLSATATIVDDTGYFTLPPCRLVDTRRADGPLGGPVLAANVARDFVLAGACGVPADAVAVVLIVTAVDSTAAGSLQIYAAGGTPLADGGTADYRAGVTRAGNAIVALGTRGAVSVLAEQSAGTVHLVLDVTGYILALPK
jgi:hypothetical protein